MGENRRRRERGDGSLYQRKSDGRWTGAFLLPDGRRKCVYAPKDNNKKEVARQLLKEAQQLAERGELVASKNLKVSDYLNYWLETRQHNVKASTYQAQAAHLHAQVVPVLGNIQLQKLTRAQLQKFVNALNGKLESSTIHTTFTIFKSALKDAVEWKMLSSNPCKGVKLPHVERNHDYPILNADQVGTLVATVAGTDIETIVILALATGMRRGELMGLKWSDIDFERGTIKVQRTVVYITGEGYKEQAPKSRTSKRTITLISFAAKALREHRRKQMEVRLRDSLWSNEELVFINKQGERYPFSSLQRNFRDALKRAGLPAMNFHGLRHSAASLLFSLGVTPKVVQEILGHANITITMEIYGHLFPGMQDDAMKRYNRLLSSDMPQREASS